MTKTIIFCYVVFCSISSFCTLPLFAQQREIHFVSFRQPQTFLFDQKGINLATYCMRWIEEGKLPIWQLQQDLAVTPMSPDSLEARKQLQRYLPDSQGTLWATDLLHTWIDGYRKPNQKALQLKFIHFFFAKDSLQNTQNLQNYVFSVKFEELWRLWKQEQQHTLRIMALNKSNKNT
ncbi:MAG: hypothetical protein ACOVQA_04890 [Thermoflexibacteraceae bacterium]